MQIWPKARGEPIAIENFVIYDTYRKIGRTIKRIYQIEEKQVISFLGPLHMSPVTGLARLPGRILWCVHMGNFSRVDQDEFKKHNQNGGT